MNRAGLGRGLSALLPDATTGVEAAAGVRQVPLDEIQPNPYQPRTEFDDTALAELAESVRQHGIVQPITVRPNPEGEGYQLVAGERRWRAARLADLATIPALVRPCTELELVEIALVENLQREDIGPIEAAVAYQRCLREFGLTQEELAQKVGKSRSAVANTLRLLKLDPTVQALVAEGQLSEGHARALLALEEAESQAELARRVLRERLNVRDTERLARELRARPPRRRLAVDEGEDGADRREPTVDPVLQADLEAYAEGLSRRLGAPVEIRPRGDGGGTIVIRYFEGEDLVRIAEYLDR